MHDTNPLTALILRERSSKPRRRGLTMVADWGLPPDRQHDLLSVAAPFVDLAKIAVGISALFTQEALARKLADYRAHEITPFPGGMYLEHAVLHDRTDDYLRAAADAGYDCIEVSDNLLEMSLDEKCALIRRACQQFGLRVLGEVGKKEGIDATCDPADDAERCLEAGSEFVFLEAAEFFTGDVNAAAVERIIQRTGLDPLIFELPGPWIKGVSLSDIHEMTRWLLDRFGPEANIANVHHDDVFKLEALRLGIGVNAGGESADA